MINQYKPLQLESLSDRDLLNRTRQLVQRERELLTEILQHLKEVERRKLFSDLGFKSLFDYAVGELGYSEGQAARRIQAMKFIRELPRNEQKKVEQQIESGALNLSNICQAQTFFNHVKKSAPEKSLNLEQKLDVLKGLENKSARQGQVVLLQRLEAGGVEVPMPKEKERLLSSEHSELRLVIGAELRKKIDEVRALLGPKAIGMSWAELIEQMADLSRGALKDKKFGKKRDSISSHSSNSVESVSVESVSVESAPIGAVTRKTNAADAAAASAAAGQAYAVDAAAVNAADAAAATGTALVIGADLLSTSIKGGVIGAESKLSGSGVSGCKTGECKTGGCKTGESKAAEPVPTKRTPKARSISKSKKYRVWQRDGGACVKCGAKDSLQIDHVLAVAFGGSCDEGNLRLLCFNCNAREGIKDFGTEKMKRPRGPNA